MSPRTDLAAMKADFGRPLVISVLLTLMSTAALLGAFTWSWLNPPLPKILGPYPEQQIPLAHERVVIDGATYAVPVLDYPANATLPVDGEKCTREDVEIVGQSGWNPEIPNDATITLSSGSTLRIKGCTTFHYDNRVPPEVATYLTALHLEGTDISLWRINGSETPVDPEGMVQTWTTEMFGIRYAGTDAG